MTARILAVDDEPDLEILLRQKFRRQIREGRFEFDFANDELEAIERLRRATKPTSSSPISTCRAWTAWAC